MKLAPADYADILAAQCVAIGLPKPAREVQFCDRKWRWDCAWVPQALAAEIQGGIYIRGRHSRGSGQQNDFDKWNNGVLLGWRILLFTSADVNSGSALALVEQALKQAETTT